MDLQHAMKAHVEWKIRFRSAIQKKERMDAAAVADHRRCEFGDWLRCKAVPRFARYASYARCVEKHIAFHAEAAIVAGTINAGNYEEAEAMLAPGSAYNEASGALCVEIMALEREAGDG